MIIFDQDQVLNLSQEPSVPSKVPNEDLKDMYIIGVFKIKIDRQNLENWCIKNQIPPLNPLQEIRRGKPTINTLPNKKYPVKTMPLQI